MKPAGVSQALRSWKLLENSFHQNDRKVEVFVILLHKVTAAFLLTCTASCCQVTWIKGNNVVGLGKVPQHYTQHYKFIRFQFNCAVFYILGQANNIGLFESQHYSDLFPDSSSYSLGWHYALFLIHSVTLRKSINSCCSALPAGASTSLQRCSVSCSSCQVLLGHKKITKNKIICSCTQYFNWIVNMVVKIWAGWVFNNFQVWSELKKGK